MYRVALVTPDESLSESLRPPLERAGFEVLVWAAGGEGEPDPHAMPDVLTLDLRHRDVSTPVVLLEAWPHAHVLGVVGPHQVAALDLRMGLEDFIVAPAPPEQFVARVQQILWRHGAATGRNLLAAGDLLLDLANYQVFESGHPLALTYKEYELLRFLMTHAGAVFTREVLLNRVWGYDYYGGARTVDVHIRRVRSKLEPRCAEYIETVRNVGYRFREPLH